MTAPRSRPLMRWVVLGAGSVALGIVETLGVDVPHARLCASKRWRRSQNELGVIEWNDATREQQHRAAMAELDAARALVDEIVR
jgi:uncharacterized protein YbaA (DUF1428 family)